MRVVLKDRLKLQPLDAIQRRARKDHTSVFWFLDDFDLPAAGNVARKKSAAIVFIASDSGEEYITVDGNQGDRSVSFKVHVAKMLNFFPM